MPNVVIDIRANHRTGISRYGLSLLPPFADAAREAGWKTTFVCNGSQRVLLQPGANIMDASMVVGPDEGFVRRSSWLRDLLDRVRADLYYTTHYTLDRHCRVPFVFTIHDLTRLRFPHLSYSDESFASRFGTAELELVRQEALALDGTHPDGANMPVVARYLRALTFELARRAERIITVSETSADDIRTLLGHSASIDVVPGAVDTSVFRPQPYSQVAAARRRYRLNGPYLLAVGLAHPNKRLPWLIEQLARGRHLFPTGSKLAIVGGYAEDDPGVRNVIADAGADSLVAFTGRVDDTDLAALYTGASALVSASVSEGYCLPPVEAAACGAPAILTGIAVLRETLGATAYFYDSHDDRRLRELAARALRGLLEGPGRGEGPGSWHTSGAALFASLSAALASQGGQIAAGRLVRE
jgi:glycosyltransferase involved in cell wall biosynthesis